MEQQKKLQRSNPPNKGILEILFRPRKVFIQKNSKRKFNLINGKKIKIFKREIERIHNKIPLDKITHHLASFLAKNIVQSLERREEVNEEIATKYIQTCVFLAGKMGERDINIPTAPDIVISGGKIFKSILKKKLTFIF